MQFTMLISTIKKYRILPRVATKTKNTDNYEIKLEVLIKKNNYKSRGQISNENFWASAHWKPLTSSC